MKRDMDLARLILLEVEKHPYGRGWVELNIEGHSPEEVHYHVMLLAQANLLEATKSVAGDRPPRWYPRTLTCEGHEFLDASRNEVTWKKAKTIVKEKGGGVTFEVIKSLLAELAKSAILGDMKGG